MKFNKSTVLTKEEQDTICRGYITPKESQRVANRIIMTLPKEVLEIYNRCPVDEKSTWKEEFMLSVRDQLNISKLSDHMYIDSKVTTAKDMEIFIPMGKGKRVSRRDLDRNIGVIITITQPNKIRKHIKLIGRMGTVKRPILKTSHLFEMRVDSPQGAMYYFKEEYNQNTGNDENPLAITSHVFMRYKERSGKVAKGEDPITVFIKRNFFRATAIQRGGGKVWLAMRDGMCIGKSGYGEIAPVINLHTFITEDMMRPAQLKIYKDLWGKSEEANKGYFK